MEEILASIRQIISEDGEGTDNAASSRAGAADDKAPSDADEETAAAVKADADEVEPDPIASDEADKDARVKADIAKAEDAFSGDDDGGDLADETPSSDGDSGFGKTESSSFDSPAEDVADVFAIEPDTDSDVEESISMAMPAENKHQSPAPISEDHLLSQDSDEVVHGAFSALAHTILAQNARTLEDLVSEMLQPMLKGWLDDNLPSLVERLVKEEIDRVSRGRR